MPLLDDFERLDELATEIIAAVMRKGQGGEATDGRAIAHATAEIALEPPDAEDNALIDPIGAAGTRHDGLEFLQLAAPRLDSRVADGTGKILRQRLGDFRLLVDQFEDAGVVGDILEGAI